MSGKMAYLSDKKVKCQSCKGSGVLVIKTGDKRRCPKCGGTGSDGIRTK